MFAISRLLRLRERWRRYKAEVMICGSEYEVVDEYTFEFVARFVTNVCLEGVGVIP